MARKHKKKSDLYQYLEPFLENGNDAKIAEARKTFWREYKAKWRREWRRERKQFTVDYTQAEAKMITMAAKEHNMSRTRFIKNAAFAYLDRVYIAPDLIQVRHLQQSIALVYNGIQELIEQEKIANDIGRILLQKIETLEKEVLTRLVNPETLQDWIVSAVQKNPDQKKLLSQLLDSIEPNDH